MLCKFGVAESISSAVAASPSGCRNPIDKMMYSHYSLLQHGLTCKSIPRKAAHALTSHIRDPGGC